MDRNSNKGADMTTTIADRKPLTTFAWSDLPPTGLTRTTARELRLAWPHLSDLEHEAAEKTSDFCTLTIDAWRALVSAAANGLPVEITHRNRSRNAYGPTTITTTKRTYIVEQIMSLGAGTTSNLYVRSWGFAFPLALGDLVDVVVPEQTFDTEIVDD